MAPRTQRNGEGSTSSSRQGSKASTRREPGKPKASIEVQTAALDASLGYSLRRAQMSTFAEFSETMDSYNLRPSHYTVLVLVRTNPGLSQTAVSRVLGIQKANLVTLLDVLEQRGWMERRSIGGDRRASALHLTRTGETFVRKAELAHGRMEASLATRLGERKSQLLLKLLREFCDAPLARQAKPSQ